MRDDVETTSEAGSDDSARSESLSFDVDASLLFQLGEQLVARRSVALSELIKNAYDADATKVTILLQNVTTPGGTIIVQDNGNGMTFDDVRERWMRVATNDKVEHPMSPRFGRPRTGAKGVGRFAARKLGEKLTLLSIADNEDGVREEVSIEFDWKTQFKPGLSLSTIQIPYHRRTVETAETGVVLHIEPVRDAWSASDVAELRRDLLTLIGPSVKIITNDAELEDDDVSIGVDPGFGLSLEAPEFPELEGELIDRFLEAAWGHLTGEVDENGQSLYRLSVRGAAEPLEYILKEELFPLLTGAKLDIRQFKFSGSFFKGLEFTLRDAQRFGRDRGGVRIYLDGFRVFPYGDPGDDWLKLNELRARRTPDLFALPRELEREVSGTADKPEYLAPGNNQLYGAVELSRLGQPGIELNISRERLVENEAFAELTRFVQVGIFWMTIEYARSTFEERTNKRRQKRPSTVQLLDQVKSKVGELAVSAGPDREIVLRSLREILEEATQTAREEEEERIGEISLLRILASAGTTVAVMDHQLRDAVEGVRQIHTDLKDLASEVTGAAKARFDNILARMADWRLSVDRQTALLEVLLGSEARNRRKRLVLASFVSQIRGTFELFLVERGVSFEIDIAPNLRTPPVFEAELSAVLFNAITNSLKALARSERRVIRVTGERDGDQLVLRVFDTGPGVEPNSRERVFDAFRTTSLPDPLLGVGTGLGLKIVRDILDGYEGTARFVDPAPPWGACLEIILPE